jgi:hypothetical protein
LTEVLVCQLVTLEVDQDVAFEQAVVEDQIDVKMVIVKREALLACLEQKAFAQFEQETFDAADDGGFKFMLGLAVGLGQVEEFEHIRVFDDIFGLDHDLT